MSGGFFRGTSADQDTRFSNKQAKLMKSQKFAPELEHLVDMTKVEMDVMRPWIAKRVTELLGFEDEVLINFIYGLLEGKVVNGKEIQISITGFMEKNTGKFMKELWTLLLSAQNNASRVPQQFLDAKEEETRSKKVEADRIMNEMMRVKEKEGREREEKRDRMDGKVDDTALPSLRHQPKDSNTRLATDDKQMNGRNGSRGRTSDSPSRSNSKSVSNSRSHSEHRSRSISGSSQKRDRSISSEQIRHSPLRRSTSPRRRDSPRQSFSPRRRTSYFRQRSMSPRSRRRSPSPTGRRLHSPIRRRSRSPVRHRSRTPERRRLRTPIRRRSRSPLLRRSRTPQRRRSRSPLRYRSPSPIRRRSRSPMSHRSPSPMRRRSPSPLRRHYRRSPSSPRRRSPSPYRRRPTLPSRRRSSTPRRRSSTPRRRSSTPPRRRSSSPQELGSQSPRRQLSPSPARRRLPKCHRSPVQSPRGKIRSPKQYSPDYQPPRHENIERGIETHKSTLERRLPISNVQSPQRGSGGQNTTRKKVPSLSPSPNNSPLGSESPPASTKRRPTENRRLSSPYESPRRQTREPMLHPRRPSPPQKSVVQKPNPDTDSQQEGKIKLSREGEDPKHKSTSDGLKLNQQKKSETKPQKVPQSEVLKQLSPSISKNMLPDVRVIDSHSGEGYRTDEKSRYHADHIKGNSQLDYETYSKVTPKINKRNCGDSVDSESEISDKPRAEVSEKRKHKRSKRTESDDDSCDSILKGRKETKRRKKEEKRLKKEEKRRRREERRRRKEERRAEKIKLKSVGTVSPPSDTEDNHDGYASDGDIDAAESEQKKLEIELRERALESLRAKKGTGH